MRILKVLIACEESQMVTKEFRALGHEAYSCDLQECREDGNPNWHIIGDVTEVLKERWDLIIAHPPCTYMSKAGARWMYPTAGNLSIERLEKALKAKEFFLKCLNGNSKHIAVENPLPLKVVGLPVHTQSIHPYQFGDPFSKQTLLWLKGLPELKHTNVLTEYKPYLPSNTGGKKRGQSYMFKNISQKESSKTFHGIAKAMAQQWSDHVVNYKMENSFFNTESKSKKIEITQEQFNNISKKADKWDNLDKIISRFYSDENSKRDLSDIGEISAAAFGFL